MDNLGLTQSNTYGRLVQIIDGRYYDGFGNRLYIGASIGTSGDGSSGVNGANGSSGSSGSSGQDGFVGSSGSSGEDGSSGITPNVEPLTEVSISPPPDDFNKVFTLSVPLTVGSQHMFFINGQLLTYGDDYTISGTTLTIDDERPAPETLDVLRLFGSVGTVLIAGSSGSSGVSGVGIHNSLDNLQGGNLTERYHITLSEHTGTGTGVLVRQSSPTIIGSITSDSFVRLNGLPSQYLMADGSITLDSNVVHLTGDEIINGNKTITGRTILSTVAITGREQLLGAQVSDNLIDKFLIANGTTTSSRFIPTFVGYTGGAYQSLIFRGLGASLNDLGTTAPYIQFLAANTNNSSDPNNGTLTAPINRDLFSWGTVGLDFLKIKSSGRILINNATDDSINQVQILGSIIATNIRKYGGLSTEYLMADGSVTTGGGTSVSIRYETTWISGSQQFTVPSDYLSVINVIVQGASLSDSQYSLQLPDKVTILDTLNTNDYVVIIYGSTVVLNADPLQIIITTTVSITTDTLGDLGKTQKGKNIIINNGANAINITVNGGTNFNSSYFKGGSGVITFLAGSGRTLVQTDGTNVFNGIVGSTAIVTSFGTVDYLRISNA